MHVTIVQSDTSRAHALTGSHVATAAHLPRSALSTYRLSQSSHSSLAGLVLHYNPLVIYLLNPRAKFLQAAQLVFTYHKCLGTRCRASAAGTKQPNALGARLKRKSRVLSVQAVPLHRRGAGVAGWRWR